MSIQAAAAPAAAIARGFFISGQTATVIPAHHEARQQRTEHHNYVRMLSIGSYHSYQ
jgi:hypothetical protein